MEHQPFELPAVAHLADACLRIGVAVRVAPPLEPLIEGVELVGRAQPIRHYGSVDVFLEALGHARPGDIFVVDNQGRDDEGCIGDLMGLEAQRAGIAAIVIWGRHHDSAILRDIGLPLFSRGSCPRGPVRSDPRDKDPFALAAIGSELVSRDDIVVIDEDGIIFIAERDRDRVFAAAEAIRGTETAQAERMHCGRSLREQLAFDAYLEARRADPAFSFRAHLQKVGGAIEV